MAQKQSSSRRITSSFSNSRNGVAAKSLSSRKSAPARNGSTKSRASKNGQAHKSNGKNSKRSVASSQRVLKRASAKKSSASKTTKKRVSKSPTSKAAHKANKLKLSNAMLIQAYEHMIRARFCDEKAIILYKQNKCHFQIGVAGHEAVQVAAALAMKAGEDWFYPYYRGMAMCAALGMTSQEFMLNAMNKDGDPNSHGRQMPMHYGHKQLNIVNQSSPTGTQFLQAVGCALASKKLGRKEVTIVTAGEGTCAQGDYHEALNWAAREKLPVIFLIENNGYAISVPIAEQHAGESVFKISHGYENLELFEIDGTDLAESFSTLDHAVKRARSGKGPTFIEAHVPRLQSHSISDNHLKYRNEADITAEKKRCPIERLRKELLKNKVLTKGKLEELETSIRAEVDEAATWAEAQPDPDPAKALDHTFVNSNPKNDFVEGTPSGEEVYMVDALNHALKEELRRDPNTFVFGQDVAHGKGGVFTVTTGLTDEFGIERCFNAPLAEASIAGVSVGLATRGLKPVAEIQFGDYIWTAMMQIRNELAMMNYRSGGDFTCPAVLRVPVGGYIHGACYHSQNIEATFSHFPGLYVVLPSNATDAKGLLKSAIRANDPVLFLEHKGLYRQVYAKGVEGDENHLIPLGKAKVVREGEDLTIVTWGALVNKSMLAAKALAEEGYSVEVIDLRTIVPLDMETIIQSVEKTNRVLIAHEDVEFMGFGAEIAAQLADKCFEQLDAPLRRVGMKYAAAVAHSSVIENVVLPQNEDVLVAARNVLNY